MPPIRRTTGDGLRQSDDDAVRDNNANTRDALLHKKLNAEKTQQPSISRSLNSNRDSLLQRKLNAESNKSTARDTLDGSSTSRETLLQRKWNAETKQSTKNRFENNRDRRRNTTQYQRTQSMPLVRHDNMETRSSSLPLEVGEGGHRYQQNIIRQDINRSREEYVMSRGGLASFTNDVFQDKMQQKLVQEHTQQKKLEREQQQKQQLDAIPSRKRSSRKEAKSRPSISKSMISLKNKGTLLKSRILMKEKAKNNESSEVRQEGGDGDIIVTANCETKSQSKNEVMGRKRPPRDSNRQIIIDTDDIPTDNLDPVSMSVLEDIGRMGVKIVNTDGDNSKPPIDIITPPDDLCILQEDAQRARQKYIERTELDIFESRIRAKIDQENSSGDKKKKSKNNHNDNNNLDDELNIFESRIRAKLSQEEEGRGKKSLKKPPPDNGGCRPKLSKSSSLKEYPSQHQKQQSRRKLLDDKLLVRHKSSMGMRQDSSGSNNSREFSSRVSFDEKLAMKLKSKRKSSEASSVRSNDSRTSSIISGVGSDGNNREDSSSRVSFSADERHDSSSSEKLKRNIESRKKASSATTEAHCSVRSNDSSGGRNSFVSTIDASEASREGSRATVDSTWDDLDAVLKQTMAMSMYCDPSGG